MTPELIKMKELMLKTYLDEHGCEYFNLSTDLDKYAQAYLDEAIRVCVPWISKVHDPNDVYEHVVKSYRDELLSNIERFKKGEI